MSQSDYRFEIAFSFAGPHRDKVQAIAELVSARIDPGLTDRSQGRVFFDDWFEHEILGDDLDVLLQSFYHDQSLMVVADLSDEYADRLWCQAEARAIRALRFEVDPARDETGRLRLLNARFGDGNVPGIFKTTAYLDGITKSPEQAADLILKRHELLTQRLATTNAPATTVTAAPTPPLPVSPSPTIRFVHPATNDDRYSRRENELQFLDDCAKNPDIRIATVTGQGGLGKTSLVGHWIQKHHGWQSRETPPFRGVLFYSFYSNRDPRAFFKALLEFVCQVENIAELPADTPLHHLAAAACRKWSYLVVLDGLEVLQHGEDDPTHYGWINDGELTEFVARVGEQGPSLLVLTSRFPFAKITDEHPDHARKLELPLLDASEGADLLAACGLDAPRGDLEVWVTQLGGHPLALRLFAGSCLEQPFSEPEHVIAHVCSPQDVQSLPDPHEPGIDDDERDRRRQRRQFFKLLRWFQQKLMPAKRRLLQLVALFRDPVRTPTLVALATGMEAMREDFGDCDRARLTGLLEQLAGQSLLQKESVGESVRWTAHPIVRDVFRDEALSAGDTVARQFADIVAGKGQSRRPQSVAEVRPIVESIEVLLAAEDLEAADELYRGRLENGQVFMWIPAPQEGLRCARAFLEPAGRRTALEQTLGRRRLGLYLNDVALLASIVGEMEEVVRGYGESVVMCHSAGFWAAVSVRLQNIADAQILRGRLGEAVASANEALFYAGGEERPRVPLPLNERLPSRFPPRPATAPKRNDDDDVVSRSYRAHALSLAGQLAAASRDFAAADALQRKNHHENASLYSRRGVNWARHRQRLGETDAARRLTEANRTRCEKNGWNSDVARCELLVGELDLIAEAAGSGGHAAADRLAAALRIFRDAGQVKYLPDVLLAVGRHTLASGFVASETAVPSQEPGTSDRRLMGDDESALSHCEEALRLAARSGFLLMKCDALNLRAKLLRAAGRLDEALANAKEAHDLAMSCHYYWGHHEALRQLRDACRELHDDANFNFWNDAEQALTEKMAPEIAEAIRINKEHDAEMEKLYGEKE